MLNDEIENNRKQYKQITGVNLSYPLIKRKLK
jgi:hypothetical protein